MDQKNKQKKMFTATTQLQRTLQTIKIEMKFLELIILKITKNDSDRLVLDRNTIF